MGEFGPTDHYDAARGHRSLRRHLQKASHWTSFFGKPAISPEAKVAVAESRQHESRVFHMSSPQRGLYRTHENETMRALLRPELGQNFSANLLKPLAPADDSNYPQWQSQSTFAEPFFGGEVGRVPDSKREQDIYVSVIVPTLDAEAMKNGTYEKKAEMERMNDCLFDKTMERSGLRNEEWGHFGERKEYTWLP